MNKAVSIKKYRMDKAGNILAIPAPRKRRKAKGKTREERDIAERANDPVFLRETIAILRGENKALRRQLAMATIPAPKGKK